MLSQFSNLSCYEEFEIQSALAGISKVDILKEIGCKIDNYYFFISEDGIFNWFDLECNHIEDPCILNELKEKHIHKNIIKCIIPNSVINIGDEAFWDCSSLKEIVIPDSVTSIGYRTFSHCYSLKEITIPDNVIYISSFAFSFCESLKEIIIPDSVKNIGYMVFFGCISLKEIIFKGKTLEEVKQMKNYPFGIKNESIIKCEL